MLYIFLNVKIYFFKVKHDINNKKVYKTAIPSTCVLHLEQKVISSFSQAFSLSRGVPSKAYLSSMLSQPCLHTMNCVSWAEHVVSKKKVRKSKSKKQQKEGETLSTIFLVLSILYTLVTTAHPVMNNII
jgi:hypothetical protein